MINVAKSSESAASARSRSSTVNALSRARRTKADATSTSERRLAAAESDLSSGLRPEDYPHLAFGAATRKTIRCFPDKLPIGIEKTVALYKAAVREERWTPLNPSVSKSLEA